LTKRLQTASANESVLYHEQHRESSDALIAAAKQTVLEKWKLSGQMTSGYHTTTFNLGDRTFTLHPKHKHISHASFASTSIPSENIPSPSMP
jgi:hypothetical protein